MLAPSNEPIHGYAVLRPLGARTPTTVAAHDGGDRTRGGDRGVVVLARTLRSALPDSVAARMIVEAQSLVVDRVPELAAVLDVVDGDDDLVVVYEYVPGITLADLLVRAGASSQALSLAVCLRVLIDALAGLHGLHELRDKNRARIGAFHGDLGPEDLVIGTDGMTRVASAVRPRPVRGAKRSAAAAWLAPELLLGEEDAGARADLYGIGVLLWETLARKRLFADVAPMDIVTMHLGGRVQRPAHPASELVDIAMRAIAVDAKKRFVSAYEMREALLRVKGVVVAPHKDVAKRVAELAGDAIRERDAGLLRLAGAARRALRADPPASGPSPPPAPPEPAPIFPSVPGDEPTTRIASAPSLEAAAKPEPNEDPAEGDRPTVVGPAPATALAGAALDATPPPPVVEPVAAPPLPRAPEAPSPIAPPVAAKPIAPVATPSPAAKPIAPVATPSPVAKPTTTPRPAPTTARAAPAPRSMIGSTTEAPKAPTVAAVTPTPEPATAPKAPPKPAPPVVARDVPKPTPLGIPQVTAPLPTPAVDPPVEAPGRLEVLLSGAPEPLFEVDAPLASLARPEPPAPAAPAAPMVVDAPLAPVVLADVPRIEPPTEDPRVAASDGALELPARSELDVDPPRHDTYLLPRPRPRRARAALAFGLALVVVVGIGLAGLAASSQPSSARLQTTPRTLAARSTATTATAITTPTVTSATSTALATSALAVVPTAPATVAAAAEHPSAPPTRPVTTTPRGARPSGPTTTTRPVTPRPKGTYDPLGI